VRGADIARALEKRGFTLSRVRGSHHIFHSSDGARRVVVPYHGNRVIPPGTLANILRQAEITDEDFRDLLK
jgi:predicted RNA binding protein YcfA (HicA-like mRNA interferase family)